MIFILVSYLVLIWLIFAKLKLIRLNWFSGTVAALVGALILAVFVALLNSLAPTGRITVASRVVEVTASNRFSAICLAWNRRRVSGSLFLAASCEHEPPRMAVHGMAVLL